MNPIPTTDTAMLDLTGPSELDTDYVWSDPINVGRAASVALWAELTTPADTTITSATLRAQISHDGTDESWVNLYCEPLDGSDGGTELAFNAIAGHKAPFGAGTEGARMINFLRVGAKVTAGGEIKATDALKVHLVNG